MQPEQPHPQRDLRVHDATERHVAAITEIYNAIIPSTTVAWTETLQSPPERAAWLKKQYSEGFPVLVAEDASDRRVIGFASYSHFRGAGVWPGYRFTVEHTIHVRQQDRGHGVGRILLEALLDRATAAGVHVMVGAVDADNEPSLRFHRQMGFVEVARMPEVGWKFGRWLDLVLVQRILER